MKEIRLHGRGGQGVLIAAEIIAGAAIAAGKYAASFPLFSAERRGAPVTAFCRIDDRFIREKTQVYSPDCVVLVDPRVRESPQLYEGMRGEGILLKNSADTGAVRPHGSIRSLGVVNATAIALKELGIPAFNTVIIGAFAAVTGWIRIEDVLSVLGTHFRGESLAKNRRCAERGYREVLVRQWDEIRAVGEQKPKPVQKRVEPVDSDGPWTLQLGRIRDAKVGDWRYFRPKKDEKCNHCGLCFLFCPTGCVAAGEKGYAANLDYCKGCGICAEECPVHAITMVKED